MKNNVLKFYIASIFFLSTFMALAAPGDQSNGDPLEGSDVAAPIDNYVWVLAAIGLIFVFMKIRAVQKNRIQG